MKNTLLGILFILSVIVTQAQTQFWSDTFEDVGAPSTGTRTPSVEYNSGQSSGYFLRTDGTGVIMNAAYTNLQGSKFWAGEDLDRTSAGQNQQSTRQSITWSNINISGKTGLSFRGLIGAWNGDGVNSVIWDNFNVSSTDFDFLDIEYSIDGAAFQKLIEFKASGISNGSGMLRVDTNADGVGDGTILGNAMQEFTLNIVGTGNLLTLRFNAGSNSSSEEFAIDNFRLFEVANITTTWNGTTWSDGAPSSTTDAIIASNTAPSSFTCKTLTINNGFALNTAGITATVNGNIVNNGNGISGTGGLTVAANSTLSGNAISFNGTLTVNSGAIFTTGNLLTLTSNSTNTGRIGNSAGGIVGSVTVQRFIPAKATRRYSLISSPVSQSLSAAWQQQIHVTGVGTGGTACPSLNAHSNGFDATLTNAPSMFTYNASNSTGNRWVANTTGTSSFTLTPGDGYRLLVRGPRATGCALLNGTSNIPAAVTLSATGNITNGVNAGNINKAYNNTGSNNWILVGNPYPSELNFSAFRTSNSSAIGASYVIYDPQNAPNSAVPANMYSTWNAGTWSNAATSISNANGQYIANGQAFFVQSTGAGALNLSFTESHKYNGTQNGVFRTQTWNDLIRIGLNKEEVNIDNTVIRFSNNPAIQNNQLGDYDATLFTTESNGVYLASSKAGNNMSIQTRSLQTVEQDEVALSFHVNQSGTYTLKFSEFEHSSIAEIYLKDNYTNTTHNINQNSTYHFVVDKNNAATSGAARFSLVFRSINPAVTTISNIKLFPNPANKQVTLQLPNTTVDEVYTIRITDISGKVQLQQKLAAGVQQLNINRLAAGNYVVEVTDSKGNRAVEKLVKQ